MRLNIEAIISIIFTCYLSLVNIPFLEVNRRLKVDDKIYINQKNGDTQLKKIVNKARSIDNAEVSFDLWGPAGDGVTDDYTKFMAALDYAKTNNSTLVLNSDKIYYIGTQLHYDFTGNIRVRSSNANKKAVIKLSDRISFPFQFSAQRKSGNTTIKKELVKGQNTIAVVSSTNFSTGDYIGLSSSTDWSLATDSEVQKGEWNIIESIAGNTLILRYPLKDNYTLSENVKISNWNYASIDIDNIEVICNDTGNNSVCGVSLRYLQDSRMTNCVIRNFQMTAVETRACYNFEFAYNQVFGTNEVGLGYGFYPLAGLKFIVHDNTFTGGRKGVDVGGAGTLGPARDVTIYNNTTYGSGLTSANTDWFDLNVVGGQSMGYAVHEGAENVLFTNNVSYNTCYGYQIRGKDVTVKGNIVYGMCIYPFATLAGYNHTYDSNEYQALLTKEKTSAVDYQKYPRYIFYSEAIKARSGQLIFKNNKADFARDMGAVLNGSNVLSDITITGNQYLFSIIDGSAAPLTVYWSHITKPINNLVVSNNLATVAESGTSSSTMRFVRDPSYKAGELINWTTCEVEGLQADGVLTLSNKNTAASLNFNFSNFKITKQGKVVRSTGKINFRSTVGCRPFLLGLPPAASANSSFFTFDCLTDKKTYIGKQYTNADIQFGHDESNFLGIYKAATDYTLQVNSEYITK